MSERTPVGDLSVWHLAIPRHSGNARGLLAVLLALGWLVAGAGAQTLDDWKAALEASRNGKIADSIPYADFRFKADTATTQIGRLSQLALNRDNGGTRAIREDIARRSARIEELNAQTQQAAVRNSTALTEKDKREAQEKIAEIRREIEMQARVLDGKRIELDQALRVLDERIAQARQGREAHRSIDEALASAVRQARRELDPDLLLVAADLIPYWEKRHAEQQAAIIDDEKNIARLEGAKRGEM